MFARIALALVIGCFGLQIDLQQLAAQSRESLLRSDLFTSLVELESSSVVPISSEGKTIAYGTAVSDDGLLVTKASLIEDVEIQCQVGERQFKPERVAVDRKSDLALIRIDTSLRPVSWDDEAKLAAGQFVVSLNHRAPIAVGVIGVARQNIGNGRRMAGYNVRNNEQKTYVTVISGISIRPNFRGDGVVVRQLEENSPAAAAGLKEDDIVLAINGSPVNFSSALRRVVSKLKAGDWVDLDVQRNAENMSVRVKLSQMEVRSQSSGNDAIDKWGGGKFSGVRFDFGSVIAHDSTITPQECGTPVFNSNGKAIGINIARALRVTSYALPAKRIVEFVEANRTHSTNR